MGVRSNHMQRMINLRLLSVFVALVCVAAAQHARQPKLFFASISSSTTTTTVSTTINTATFCYTKAATVTTACKRKKRSIVEDPLSGEFEVVQPSSPTRRSVREIAVEAEPSSEAKASQRNARFFLLLTSTSTISATVTSTATAFTGTATVSLLCIPTSMSACG